MKTTRPFFHLSMILILGLLLGISVSADVVIPRAKRVFVKTKQDFPKFDFYFCVIPVSSYYDKGRHYTTHYEKLDLKPIQFSSANPFEITNTNNDDKMYFVAFGKDSAIKESSELKNRVVAKIKSKQGDGIYFFEIDTKVTTSQDKGNLVYIVENISDAGLKSNRQYGDSENSSNSEVGTDDSEIQTSRTFEGSNAFLFTTVGIGLLLSGAIVFFGLRYVRKSKNK